MQLDLTPEKFSGQTITPTDVFLLDEVVAVRISVDNLIEKDIDIINFFIQPLVRAEPVSPIPMADTDFVYNDFLSLGFAPNHG